MTGASTKPILKAAIALIASGSILSISATMIRIPLPEGEPYYAQTPFGQIVRVQPRRWIPIPHSGILSGVGIAIALGGVALGTSTGSRWKDWEDATDSLVLSAFDGAINLSSSLLKKLFGKPVRQARILLIQSLPERLQKAVIASAGNEVFRKFIKFPHNRIVGRTGAGKSFLVCHLLVCWIEENPQGILTICDINYGKPDRETGEIFDWLGLPYDCIRDSAIDIFEALLVEIAELNVRRWEARNAAIQKTQAPSWQPRLLLVDEIDSTNDDLADLSNEDVNEIIQRVNEQYLRPKFEGKLPDGVGIPLLNKSVKNPFMKYILQLMKQGNGYRMKFIGVGQSITTGESGFSQASKAQTAIAMLGTDTVQKNLVAQFNSSKTEELVAESSVILKAKSRPMIIQLGDGEPVTMRVPDLSASRRTRIQYVDPVKQQWLQLFTADKQQQLETLAMQLLSEQISAPPGSGGSVKGLVLPLLGLKNSDLTKPIWKQYGSPAWEAAKAKVSAISN